jgi:hypothetical protein
MVDLSCTEIHLKIATTGVDSIERRKEKTITTSTIKNNGNNN